MKTDFDDKLKSILENVIKEHGQITRDIEGNIHIVLFARNEVVSQEVFLDHFVTKAKELFSDTLLKIIGEPDGYGETMQDAIEAKAKNSLRAEIKSKVFKELGIKV